MGWISLGSEVEQIQIVESVSKKFNLQEEMVCESKYWDEEAAIEEPLASFG